MTPAPSLISIFVAPLNRARIEYIVTGGLASVVYGHPRLTVDVDLVLGLDPPNAEQFAALWPSSESYCPPLEVLREEGARAEHGHFNVTHNESGLRADIYLAGADELQHWALQHCRIVTLEAEEVRLAPLEYVIAYKLRYVRDGGSDRHLWDVARMLQVNEAQLDRAVLDRWIEHLHVQAEWERAAALHG